MNKLKRDHGGNTALCGYLNKNFKAYRFYITPSNIFKTILISFNNNEMNRGLN